MPPSFLSHVPAIRTCRRRCADLVHLLYVMCNDDDGGSDDGGSDVVDDDDDDDEDEF